MEEQLIKFQERCKDVSSPFYDLWRDVVKIALEISEKRFDLAYENLSGNAVKSEEYENLQRSFSETKANLFSQCQKAGIELPEFFYKEISELFPIYP